MAAIMMMAELGGRNVVNGSKMAMPEEGPIPGSTPTRVPMRLPTSAQNRFCQFRAMENPMTTSY
jgi:hypothetical protein